MINIIDNANIMGGYKVVLSDKEKDEIAFFVKKINAYRKELHDYFLAKGLVVKNETKEILNKIVEAINNNNNTVINDVKNIVSGGKSNLTISAIVGAIGSIFGFFKTKAENKPNPNQVTEQIIALQKEREQAAKIKTVVIFASLALVAIVAIIVTTKATGK